MNAEQMAEGMKQTDLAKPNPVWKRTNNYCDRP